MAGCSESKPNFLFGCNFRYPNIWSAFSGCPMRGMARQIQFNDVSKRISIRPITTAQIIWPMSSWKLCTPFTLNCGDSSNHGQYLIDNVVTQIDVILLPPLSILFSTLVTSEFTYWSAEIVQHVLLTYNNILGSDYPRYMSVSVILSYLSLKSSYIIFVDFPVSADIKITSLT